MELRGAPRGPVVDDALAEQILGAVVDGGIKYIDYGVSEARIGATLCSRRSEFYLASKCGCAVNPAAGERAEHVFTRENVLAGVEHSLRRLRTDYLAWCKSMPAHRLRSSSNTVDSKRWKI